MELLMDLKVAEFINSQLIEEVEESVEIEEEVPELMFSRFAEMLIGKVTKQVSFNKIQEKMTKVQNVAARLQIRKLATTHNL